MYVSRTGGMDVIVDPVSIIGLVAVYRPLDGVTSFHA
jgi:hypothetical protein